MLGKKAALFMGLGFELTGLIIGGVYVGGKADEYWGLKGLGTGIGAFLGLGIWLWHLLLMNKTLEKEDPNGD